MNKIKEFLTTEKNNLKVERKEKESNIYRCELNIASIDDAIKKLELQVDNTINVFKPADTDAAGRYLGTGDSQCRRQPRPAPTR